MFCKMIPLAVAIVLVVGCKKNESSSSGGGPVAGGGIAGGMPDGGADSVAGGNAGDGGTNSDPNATYTIKFRPEQAGDKTDKTVTETGTEEFNVDGKGEKQKHDKKLEYTEHIIELPAGAAKPTKVTLTYKVAQEYSLLTGAMKSLSYEGKTVAIAKEKVSWRFTVDGKTASFVDSPDLLALELEFLKGSGSKVEELLPKSAVKIGETWTAELEALKALGVKSPFPIDAPSIDAAKSRIIGKLSRVYTKDGKQWGVIALDCDLVVSDTITKSKSAGVIKINVTFDAVIDGSSREGTLTIHVKTDVTASVTDATASGLQAKKGLVDMKISANMVVTKTMKVAK